MPRFLRVISGGTKGERFEVHEGSTAVFGRGSKCTHKVIDAAVSRAHCEIELRGESMLLTDLGSRTGTFVNNHRVTEDELEAGDILRIGSVQMLVEAPEGTEIESLDDNDTKKPAPRPVLKTAERLPELTGSKLSHYAVGSVLARGESGLVFRGHDAKHDRAVALKVLWPEFSENEEEMQRFVRAMKTMLPLRHPNLVELYGAGKSGPYAWIAMQLVDGESLTQVIQRIGIANMLDWRYVCRVGYYLTKALEYAHGQGIIHRNLTPQNVIVGKTPDKTMLGDVMLAKAMQGILAEGITKPGQLVGDVRYMSPERTGGGGQPDERSDLYSLGALMYALLTGRPPFDGGDIAGTVTKIRQAELVRPKKYQQTIADLFEGLVIKLLAKRPDERFPSATALVKEFDRVARFNNVAF